MKTRKGNLRHPWLRIEGHQVTLVGHIGKTRHELTLCSFTQFHASLWIEKLGTLVAEGIQAEREEHGQQRQRAARAWQKINAAITGGTP